MQTSMASARCSVQACTILAMHLSWVVKLHTGRAGKRDHARLRNTHNTAGHVRSHMSPCTDRPQSSSPHAEQWVGVLNDFLAKRWPSACGVLAELPDMMAQQRDVSAGAQAIGRRHGQAARRVTATRTCGRRQEGQARLLQQHHGIAHIPAWRSADRCACRGAAINR